MRALDSELHSEKDFKSRKESLKLNPHDPNPSPHTKAHYKTKSSNGPRWLQCVFRAHEFGEAVSQIRALRGQVFFKVWAALGCHPVLASVLKL